MKSPEEPLSPISGTKFAMPLDSLVSQVCVQWVAWPWSICWPRKPQATLWLLWWVELLKPSCAGQAPLPSTLKNGKVSWSWHWRQGGSPGSGALNLLERALFLLWLLPSAPSHRVLIVFGAPDTFIGTSFNWSCRKNSRKRPLPSAH